MQFIECLIIQMVILIRIFLICLHIVFAGRLYSQSFDNKSSVIDAAGRVSSSNSYNNTSAIGQPVSTSKTSSDRHINQSGFLNTLREKDQSIEKSENYNTPRITGYWDFSNELNAITGEPLKYIDGDENGITATATLFGTTEQFGIENRLPNSRCVVI